MPEVAWETIVGALALVALVAGAQYIRTSGSPLSTPTKQGIKETVQDVKQKMTGESGKKKKKASAAKKSGKSGVSSSDVNVAESRDEAPSTSTLSTSGSYAEIAQSAAQDAGVGHDEVIDPAPASSKKSNKKKKKAKTAVTATEVPSINVTEASQPKASTESPVAPDTSNDASLAAALSAEEQNTTTANETSSDSESDDDVAPLAAQKKSAGGWEKPKKVVGGGSDKVAAGWETASTSRRKYLARLNQASPIPDRLLYFYNPASITSTNRFSALSIGSPSSHGAAHKKSLPRTSASGAGKHKVDSSADASTPTKLQKKNAASAAAKKAAKEAEEKERLERLAKYRKEQVKEKINALYTKPKQSGVSVAANNRSLSNGMNASVNTQGQLVWD
ncbi:hypothetical protein QFC22_002372 [Naganishia vaughanmartiniae]|uniref:Uncharacterized protein n=1 Tax=Naganishia vaughanmartiniae TaxID=1424756 RepID=A0ACC2XFE3_9TREE|nr:hypothetical protein QFC22_002372 [Naganishia vaughanmartiniae]